MISGSRTEDTKAIRGVGNWARKPGVISAALTLFMCIFLQLKDFSAAV